MRKAGLATASIITAITAMAAAAAAAAAVIQVADQMPTGVPLVP